MTADRKVTELTELTTVADDDWLYVVDKSNTADDAAGSSFKAQAKNVRGYPITAAETSAGVTPVNYQYAPFDLRRYGVVGDGITDDTAAIQRALDTAGQSGGTVIGQAEHNYLFSANLVTYDGVTLDGQGCTFTIHTTFTDTPVGGFNSALIHNSNWFTFGSAQEEVHYKNFTLEGGYTAVFMSGLKLNNTINSTVDNVTVKNTNGLRMQTGIDIDSKNYNTSITRCKVYKSDDGTVVNGAAFAIRNAANVVSKNIVVDGNYFYKDGAINPNEVMWINGAGGQTSDIRVTNNTFETSAADGTTSALTIYRFAEGGLTASRLSNVLVQGNTFLHPAVSNAAVIVGYLGDTDYPLENITISNNYFGMKAGTSVDTLSDVSGLIIANNTFENLNTDTTRVTGIDLSSWPDENAIVTGNTFLGLHSTAINGIMNASNNYCENATTFAITKSGSILSNNEVNCVQFGVQCQGNSIIQNNTFNMISYSGNATTGGVHKAVYVTAGTKVDIINNTIEIYDPRFKGVRASAALSPFVRYMGNNYLDHVFTITGAADNGAGLIRITSVAHMMTTGKTCVISDVGGTTEANATWTVTYVDADNFDLDSSSFSNGYTSGGEFYGRSIAFQTFSTAFGDMYNNQFNGTNLRISSYDGQPGSIIIPVEEPLTTLDDTGTPSVSSGHIFKTGGTTAITDFDGGVVGQTIQILSAHAITITDGTPIILNGSANFVMAAADTLTLTMFNDQVWQEVSRTVNL